MRGAWLPIGCLFVAGCLGTRLVKLDNVTASWTPPPGGGWRADVAELLERYEAMPVLAPEDTRLVPLYGGLTTLTYFGADAEPRVKDQLIPADGASPGRSLSEACAAPAPDEAQLRAEALALTGVPAFVSVWVPLALQGDAVPANASCDANGRPIGAAAETSFCVFGRLARQDEAGRPLILVVHGMFDSGAQLYVQRLAAILYSLGYSVLLPDLRDHGETLRAAPLVATTLGALEGQDLLALVDAARRACAGHIGRTGLAAVSAGGLAAIRALTLDERGSLDAGVLALSPLLDVDTAISDLSETGSCALTRGVELSWVDDMSIGVAAGLAFLGGAAVVQALHGDALDGRTVLAGAIGAGAGLGGALALDAWFDGGSEPCVARHAIGTIVQDVLRVRWRTLRDVPDALSPSGRLLEPDAITLRAYLRDRAEFRAGRQRIALRHFEPGALARELRTALAARSAAPPRLLVLGAEDDPMVRAPALHDLAARTRDMPEVYARVVRRGGHAAMSMVQPNITRAVLQRFFTPE